ncbi:MAG: gamma-glutamyl-gamma-aminobutyrate hydrolase family protein [Bacteroidales bacterium]|nr:gamma-glutamyl-gamma-aminobutyrate hydrolase family protein [Bacteroidales bacterium]
MKSKRAKFFAYSCCLFFSLVLISCSQTKEEPLHIAVSKLSDNYSNWLLQSNPSIAITDMYGLEIDSAVSMLEKHHALLITGGEDVFPGLYGRIRDTARCGEFDRYRDTLEIMLIQKALEMGLPILGICRGHQILNVALGGTLFIDIPDDIGRQVIHRCDEDPLQCQHEVFVFHQTLLQEITDQTQGTVTTNHHQAIRGTAPGLRMSAVAEDGVIEAVEWEDYQNKPFLLGVQWHPERMEEYPELSRPIAERFIEEAKAFANAVETIKQETFPSLFNE